jgi:thioredoxin 1
MVKVLKFTAVWCGPCKTLAPIIEQLKTEMNIDIEDKDIDSNMELAKDFNIISIPTMVILKNDKEVDRIIGLTNKKNIQTTIEKYL